MLDSQHGPATKVFPSQSSPSSSTRTDSNRWKIVYAVAGVALVGSVVGMFLFSDSGRESEVIVDNRSHTIQLDVMNAVGEAKLAQRMTEFLRSRGFDVVEIGNYREALERTLVIDRTGNPQAALQVARTIGVPPEQVIQRIDKTLYLDVSVFIGKDYPSLQPFQ
ncbi:MAG: LytR C-terminal domain-containing protein [Ignavibacteriales bacterium]|nr:LytR C-terminal domain-containing protein [Ignavibacteriales bacterium]